MTGGGMGVMLYLKAPLSWSYDKSLGFSIEGKS